MITLTGSTSSAYRNARVMQAFRSGNDTVEIAALLGMTEAEVYNVLSAVRLCRQSVRK